MPNQSRDVAIVFLPLATSILNSEAHQSTIRYSKLKQAAPPAVPSLLETKPS
jgi:hypothetical protein